MNLAQKVLDNFKEGSKFTYYAELQRIRQELTSISRRVTSIAGIAKKNKSVLGERTAKEVESLLDKARALIFKLPEK